MSMTDLLIVFARINHSCSPNVIWSWVSGTYNVKEIRAVRNIDPGEELCANYIDSFEVNRHKKSSFTPDVVNVVSYFVRARCQAQRRDKTD